jgi:hypothetical protein
MLGWCFKWIDKQFVRLLFWPSLKRAKIAQTDPDYAVHLLNTDRTLCVRALVDSTYHNGNYKVILYARSVEDHLSG